MWNSRKTENLKQFFAHEKSLQASKASNDRVKDTLRCWIETNLRHYRCKYSMMTGDYVRASIRLHNGSINLLNISRSTPFAIVATVLTFVPTIFIPCRAYFSCAQNILFKTKTFFFPRTYFCMLYEYHFVCYCCCFRPYIINLAGVPLESMWEHVLIASQFQAYIQCNN